MTAKRAPIFAQRGLAQRHNYPHVYDVFSNLKNMAGFINGKKVGLIHIIQYNRSFLQVHFEIIFSFCYQKELSVSIIICMKWLTFLQS